MKKLTVWHKILLVLFYPAGIAYLIFWLRKRKKAEKQEEPTAEPVTHNISTEDVAEVVETEVKTDGDRAEQQKRASRKTTWIVVLAIFALTAVSGAIRAIVSLPEMNLQRKPTQLSSRPIPGDSVADGTILSKTVMIYLDGADIEESSANASEVITDILKSGVDMDTHNILIYTCGANAWQNYDIPTNKDCIYLLRNGQLNLLAQYKAKNVGSSETLRNFMQFCTENYPAQQYGLILVDHGGGPNYGVCSDIRNNHDTLSMKELQYAFSQTGFGPQDKMEFVIFDACLMASVETAWSIKDYAHYMAASENVSYCAGSDYSFMKLLNTANSGAVIGAGYVDAFYEKSEDLVSFLKWAGKSVYDVTYSCLDLSKMDQMNQALDAVFAQLNADESPDSFNVSFSIKSARGVNEYADSYGAATDAVYDLVDMWDWLDWFGLYYPEEMEQLRDALDDLVVRNKANTDRMHGVTIYYPRHIKGAYTYNSFGISAEYTKFVKTCYEYAVKAQTADTWSQIASNVPQQTGQGNKGVISMGLTQQQQREFASAQYYILANYPVEGYTWKEDEYVLVSGGDDVTLDANGILRANYDMQVALVTKEDGTVVPVTSTLFCNKTEDGMTTYSMYAGLQYVPDVSEYPDAAEDPDGLLALQWAIENMRLDVAKLVLTEENGILHILCAEKTADSNFPSRELLDVNDYHTIEFFSAMRKVARDENGNILPVSQWGSNSSATVTSAYDIEKITLTMGDLHEQANYYGILVITDIYGNTYTSSIIPIQN